LAEGALAQKYDERNNKKIGAGMEQFIKNFVRVGAGTWVCIRDAEFISPAGYKIQAALGARYEPGSILSKWLEEQYEQDKRKKQGPQ